MSLRGGVFFFVLGRMQYAEVHRSKNRGTRNDSKNTPPPRNDNKKELSSSPWHVFLLLSMRGRVFVFAVVPGARVRSLTGFLGPRKDSKKQTTATKQKTGSYTYTYKHHAILHACMHAYPSTYVHTHVPTYLPTYLAALPDPTQAKPRQAKPT